MRGPMDGEGADEVLFGHSKNILDQRVNELISLIMTSSLIKFQ